MGVGLGVAVGRGVAVGLGVGLGVGRGVGVGTARGLGVAFGGLAVGGSTAADGDGVAVGSGASVGASVSTATWPVAAGRRCFGGSRRVEGASDHEDASGGLADRSTRGPQDDGEADDGEGDERDARVADECLAGRKSRPERGRDGPAPCQAIEFGPDFGRARVRSRRNARARSRCPGCCGSAGGDKRLR